VHDADALITNDGLVWGVVAGGEYWMLSHSTRDGRLDGESGCASDSEPTGADTTLDEADISFKG
jgi:hypothetical protein